MSLKEKHKSKIFILIIGVIIFAHAVIPHHHQYNNIVEYHNTHNENHQKHCHAFNIVIFEKSNNIALTSQVFQDHFKLLNIDEKLYLSLNINNFFNINFSDFYYQKQILFSNHSLRAPPTIV